MAAQHAPHNADGLAHKPRVTPSGPIAVAFWGRGASQVKRGRSISGVAAPGGAKPVWL